MTDRGRRYWLAMVLTVFCWTAGFPAQAAAENLTAWTPWSYPGDGSIFTQPGFWDVDSTATAVVQRTNGAPTFFISPQAATGQRVTLEFTAPIVADDDFFGVALGVSPAMGTATDDYLLLDWRQADQEIDWFGGGGAVVGTRGLALSRVTGLPAWDELWGHLDQPETPGGAVAEMARGVTLGDTGWVAGAVYALAIEYTQSRLRVWVDDVLQFDLSGSFPDGSFALYDFSLAGLTASNINFSTLNSPPAVIGSGAADVTVAEGEVAATTGGFTDDDGDVLVLSCTGQCGGFVDNGDGTWAWAQLEEEGPSTHSVTISASDGALTAVDDFTVTVLNLAPVITSTAGVNSTHHLDQELAVTADFTDAGVTDLHTATFDWGDGTTTSALVVESPGAGTASASHQYSTPGLYTVTVTVWDDDGDWDQATLGEVFVFDPDTFVTGGGWYQSPPGAVTSDPDLEGKATFGFVVRYRDDASVTGNLQFTLHKGISLHAEEFETLWIAGGVAEFSGTARVNGEPGYDFLVVATDERYATSLEDLFWITVSYQGVTLYDGSVLPPGGVPIRGRGIQIHD